MSRIRSNVYAKEDNHVPSWVFFSFLSLNLIDQFLFPHFKFFKASYLCISLSLPRCVYFTLDLGEKCKKPGVRFPTVSLNNYSSFILNTYFLAGSIKCVKKHAFFWDAQLTAEWPRSVVGLGEPCGVGSHLYRVSRGAASPPGAPSVLEGGAQEESFSPLWRRVVLAGRLLLKLKFGFHVGFYDANILSTTLKILPLKTVSCGSGPSRLQTRRGTCHKLLASDRKETAPHV